MGPDPNYKVFNEDIEIALKGLGDFLGAQLPHGWGFTLLLFDFNKGADGSLFYISNGRREDILNMMKEFIKLNEADEATQKAKEV